MNNLYDEPKTRFELMLAFFGRRRVCVRIDGRIVYGVINVLEHEDGSGCSFNATVCTGNSNVSGYIGRFKS